MTPLPQPDATSQPTNPPITVRLPAVLHSTGEATPYGCELVIPITLKVPLILQIEVLSQPPQCHTQEQIPLAQPIAAVLSSVPKSSPAQSFVQSFVQSPEHIISPDFPLQPSGHQPSEQAMHQTSLRSPLQKISGLLGLILRYIRPNHTVTLILLGALLGTTCSSIIVMHGLEGSATPRVERLMGQLMRQ